MRWASGVLSAVRRPRQKVEQNPGGGVCMCASREQLFATPTAARQVPPSMGFPRRGHWSGLPFPPPGDLPESRIEPESPAWWTGSLPLSRSPGKLRLPGKGALAVSRWPGAASGASSPGAESQAEPGRAFSPPPPCCRVGWLQRLPSKECSQERGVAGGLALRHAPGPASQAARPEASRPQG